METLDEQNGRVIDLAGRVLGRARVVAGVAGGDGIDGQQRHAAVDAHRRDAHLRGQFLAVERPAEGDGHVALGDAALDGQRLAGRQRLFADGELEGHYTRRH